LNQGHARRHHVALYAFARERWNLVRPYLDEPLANHRPERTPLRPAVRHLFHVLSLGFTLSSRLQSG